MVNTFRAIAVIVLSIIIGVVIPAERRAKANEDFVKGQVHAVIVEYVDSVRGKGYAEPSDYQVMLKKLDATMTNFDVTLQYNKKIYVPTYTNPNDFSTFQNTYTVQYDGYFTKDILNVLFPNNSTPSYDPSRRFPMHPGDFFSVHIESKGESALAKIQSLLYPGVKSVPVIDDYGGMIRSEAP